MELANKGSAIRGRKVDSPRLVVVKELREQEDQDEFDQYAGGFLARRDMLNISHNEGLRPPTSHSKQRNRSREMQKRPARSVENVNKRKRSKERMSQPIVIAAASKPPVPAIKERATTKMN